LVAPHVTALILSICTAAVLVAVVVADYVLGRQAAGGLAAASPDPGSALR
jgi:hypothetical protein